jgi:hypothetical protein
VGLAKVGGSETGAPDGQGFGEVQGGYRVLHIGRVQPEAGLERGDQGLEAGY